MTDIERQNQSLDQNAQYDQIHNKEGIPLEDLSFVQIQDVEKRIESNGNYLATESNEDTTYDDNSFQNKAWAHIDELKIAIKDFYQPKKKLIWNLIYLTLALGYTAYIAYACIYDFEEALIMLIITCIVASSLSYVILRNQFGELIYQGCCLPLWRKIQPKWKYLVWPLRLVFLGIVAIVLYFLTKENPRQLISLAGLAVLILMCLICSKHPRKVNWQPVVWGLAIQFTLGLFILRTKVGFYIFNFMGDFTKTFVSYVAAGSIFVFGDTYEDHFFAFVVLPVIIYFCSVVSVLYYLGIMQAVVSKITWLMQHSIKTTAPESVNAAGNIIVGLSEAFFLIGPYISKMTKSELLAIMCCGLATMSGDSIGVYSSLGINPLHLLAALVMSSPAALAVAKVLYPETEQSQAVDVEHLKLPKSEEKNIIEAATVGASQAIPAVLNIIANLIVFVALLALFNGVFGYGGGLVGYPQLSVELIFSYLFMPIAYMMGVEWDDCGIVGELLGIKTFINEFVAYERLGVLIGNRESGDGATISERSEVIATYALCGFDNFGSVGMQLGTLVSIVPERKRDFSGLAIRALIGGTLACYVTACTAGLLYVSETVPANATMIITAL